MNECYICMSYRSRECFGKCSHSYPYLRATAMAVEILDRKRPTENLFVRKGNQAIAYYAQRMSIVGHHVVRIKLF